MNAPALFKTDTALFREKWIGYVHRLQDTICAALENADGKSTFKSDDWERSGGKGEEAEPGFWRTEIYLKKQV